MIERLAFRAASCGSFLGPTAEEVFYDAHGSYSLAWGVGAAPGLAGVGGVWKLGADAARPRRE